MVTSILFQQMLLTLYKRPKIHSTRATEFLRRENCNFITIDWTELGSGIDYPLIIIRNIPLAASETGYVLNKCIRAH
jgi:hypothetical protein